jgi:macrolide transport system ATP-binding/permease protein
MLIDLISLAWSALAGHRVRTVLNVLGVAVGIAAVVALGEGACQYVIQEFTSK